MNIAIVSHLNDDQINEIECLHPSFKILNCSENRDLLVSKGKETEIVFGNVRPFELPKLPNLKWIQASWTGIENLLYPEMIKRKIIITCTKGQNAVTMAEHTLGLLLSFTRDLKSFYEGSQKGIWKAPNQIRKLEGSTVLLIGLGQISKEILIRLKPFNVKIWGVNTQGTSVDNCDEVFTLDAIKSKLNQVDHLILCIPATAKSHKIINRKFLESLKKGCTIINIGRGKCLDEDALVDLLDSNDLSKAGLDVTDPEPPIATSRILAHPKIILTGHNSPKPLTNLVFSFELFKGNLINYIDGDISDMKGLVDINKGY